MKLILLTKGFETAVDDSLFDWLNQHRWYASGLQARPARRLKDSTRRLVFMYHEILGVDSRELKMKGLVVDHIDRDPLNNCMDNLRIVSVRDNALNSSRHLFRVGISPDYTHGTYKAYVDRPRCPRINVGTYRTYEEAENALAVKKAELGYADH